jgi:phosphoenolpyruvate synthase/pyruvate phosphate dikinase
MKTICNIGELGWKENYYFIVTTPNIFIVIISYVRIVTNNLGRTCTEASVAYFKVNPY